jgi:hypothetical protein
LHWGEAIDKVTLVVYSAVHYQVYQKQFDRFPQGTL